MKMNTTLRRLSLLFLAVLTVTVSMMAQDRDEKRAQREQWLREVRQLKHEYFEKELKITDDQKTKFFALYDAMDDERRAAGRDVRRAERELRKKGTSATDKDYDRVAAMKYELKGKENEIEMKYYHQFKTILTNRQLYQLKQVEQDFNNFIREQHRQRRHKR